MAKSNDIDVRIKLAIESKEYNAAVRKANAEAKEFKRQQREAFKKAGEGASEGFGKMIAAAKKLAPAVSAGAAAFEVIKRAVQSNNSLFDEYERTIAAAQASFTSFSTSLARVDFSNFIDQMGEVISNAREAASAIQDLDDAKLFGRKAQAEIDFEAEGYYSVLKNKNASRADVDAALAGLADLRTRQENANLDVASANRYANATLFAEILSSQGQSASALDFVRVGADGRYKKIDGTLYDKYFGSLAAFHKMTAIYERFKDDNKSIVNWQKVGYVTDKESGETIGKSDFKLMRAVLEGVTGEKMAQLFGYEMDALANLTAVRRARNQDMRIAARWTDGGSAGGGAPSAKTYAEGSIGWYDGQITSWNEKMLSAADDIGRHIAWAHLEALKDEREMISGIAPGVASYLSGKGVEMQGMSLGLRKTSLDLQPNVYYKPQADANGDLADSSEKAAEGIVMVSDALQQLGIFSGIADEGLRAATSFIGKALGIVGSVLPGPLGKALGGIGGLIGSFDGGGIIGGTSYTGDRLVARVNSGEMILNPAQQRQLFDMANGGGGSDSGVTSAALRGEDLYFALRNYGRRTGKIHLP